MLTSQGKRTQPQTKAAMAFELAGLLKSQRIVTSRSSPKAGRGAQKSRFLSFTDCIDMATGASIRPHQMAKAMASSERQSQPVSEHDRGRQKAAKPVGCDDLLLRQAHSGQTGSIAAEVEDRLRHPGKHAEDQIDDDNRGHIRLQCRIGGGGRIEQLVSNVKAQARRPIAPARGAGASKESTSASADKSDCGPSGLPPFRAWHSPDPGSSRRAVRKLSGGLARPIALQVVPALDGMRRAFSGPRASVSAMFVAGLPRGGPTWSRASPRKLRQLTWSGSCLSPSSAAASVSAQCDC